jgi:hypothetical protein
MNTINKIERMEEDYHTQLACVTDRGEDKN